MIEDSLSRSGPLNKTSHIDESFFIKHFIMECYQNSMELEVNDFVMLKKGI